ncbi:Ig-like domain-containing protein [Daejeonella lutea]|nr:gliding motility-associated C-terminal domain-containing protein [Daejeonella lutea]
MPVSVFADSYPARLHEFFPSFTPNAPTVIKPGFLLSKSRVANAAPEAIDVKNFYLQAINLPYQILPLIGSDADGSIASFKIITRTPANPQGRLMLNNVQVSNGQVLTPAEAKLLKFEPRSGFTGVASFTYTVTDNAGLSDSSPATFTIPVTNDPSLLVCSGTGLGTNILGANGTFSSPYITPNNTVNNCINNGSTTAGPVGNLGNSKPLQTTYTYASTSGGLGPEGTYSFLKTLGTISASDRNCIKTDWVASDHTGDGGYAMIVNGSPNSATFGKTFYQATSIAVCPNTLYEFSAYVINVLPGNHVAAAAGSEPNISFYINGELVSTSGAISYSTAATNWVPQWVKVGGLWYSGPNTSVDLKIDNATFVAGGNDLGLDDISMAICGPDITYPNIDLTARYCSYGVLPLKADIKASINTYSAYIFQNSIDGGLTWTDMGTAKIGSPVYNSTLNVYEYQATYGDIPITPSMDGYRYRLKVATDINNLTGTLCNVSADKIITVSTFNYPSGGADITGCNSSATAKLVAAAAGETWTTVAGNPSSATIDQSGNIAGMTANGIYKFQLTNTVGCSDTVNVTRDEIKSAGSDAFVCGSSTTLKLADAGAGYKWEIVAGNPASATINPSTGAIAGLTVDGVYRFILRSDYGGCTDEILITKATISPTSTKTDVLCFGASTGAIDLSVTGGTGPYSYSWSNGQTTQDLAGLPAGTYTVLITDSKGCSITYPVTINQPLELTLSSVKSDVLCFGASTGSINLTVAGGTGPYTYSWTGGTTSTTEDLTNLSAGSYTVFVKDVNNCSATATIIITQPAAALSVTSTKSDVLCFGASTGSINLTSAGGTGPYTYSWTGGITATTEDLTNLAAGSYTVTVTDANNCSATATITITQPAAALTLSSTQVNVLCFGASTGSINLTAIGGTGSYTYSWTGGTTAITEDLTNLAAGTYTVTVSDANNCSATATITITQPAAALSLTSTKSNVVCFGASTGSINLTATGGTGPYTYSWTGGTTATTEDLTNLSAASYTVTVTDANNCSATATITIAQPAAALTLTSTQTNVLCFGASTGSINLTAAGGTGAYTYSWTGGITATTEDLTNLAAGSYTVILTDANNCSATATITITQPAAAMTLSSTQVDVLCFGASTGSINLTATGGTGAYTYSWTGGTTASTEDLTNLAAGTYMVTVTDANNCSATANITIAQPASALTLTSTKSDVLCFGASTGSINLTATGGTGPYTYSWTGGTTATTEDLTNLAAGTYTAIVTDANNCSATATIMIAQPAAALTLTSTNTDVLCFGASTGSINLTVSGGTGAYTYSWTGGTTASTEDLTNLPAGMYTVTVTDANNCSATTTISIIQPASGLTVNSTQSDVRCFGTSTGAIDLSVTGGIGPYTYNWSNGLATQDLSGLAAGTYTVTVTDSKGCSATLTFTINQPLMLTVTSTQIDVLCFGASTGSINLIATGGTGAYTYSWTGGTTASTEDLTNLAAGTYTVTVTDANNCSATATITIVQPAAALTLSSTQVDVLCFGASTGSINLTAAGGTGPYTYSWTGGITATTEDLTNLAAGTYTVTVTDANNCSATATITITQPAAALSLTSTKSDVLCFGASTGSINLTATGGTGPYTYSWTGGTTATTEDLTNLSAGSYTVSVTDANNCSATATITIAHPAAALTLTSTQTNVLCFGASTGSINLTAAGGTGAYTYSWTRGITATTEDLTNLAAGSYTVIVTDANNCSATATITIAQPAAALTLTSTQTNVLCFGASTGSINLTAAGGTGAYTYSWTRGITATTEDLTNLAAGSYTVIVTDANNCSATATITIAQPAAALTLTSTQTNVLCFGASTGSINLTAAGGTGAYTYSWTGGITATTEDLTNLAAGSYTVIVTDANNCSATATITITQPAAALTLSSTQVDVLCFGASTGSINLTATGGTGAYTYSWTGGTTASTEDLTNLAAGTYMVTVTDANNCSATATITITQPAAALTLSSTRVDVLCFGASTGSINLTATGGTGPYTYSWTGGTQATTEDLTNLAAGSYTVTVTDASNCSATSTINITQPASALTLTSTKTDVLCFGAITGSINLTVAGGTGAYTYSWTGGTTATTEDLTNLAAGTYTVTVTDVNNCSATAAITITQPASALTLTSTKSDVLCFGASTGSINLTATGGTGAYTYSWTGGTTATTEDLTNLSAGTYTVTVTDANNCSATATITITQPAAALSLTSTKSDVLCFGASTGSINLTATGGTGAYTYRWTGGTTASTEDLTNLAAGTYSVIVTDANNCSATTTITITQPAAALTLTSTQTNVLCFGASTGSINLTAAGGTGAYTYSWTGGITATTEDLTNLAAGSYTVIVTDANNCSATATITITQPAAALTLSSTQVDVLCFGASTGSINLTATGGTGAYTYSWTGGTIATTEDLTNLAAGTYMVTVTDANNCSATATITITQPAAALSVTSTKSDVLCFGASTGSINLTASGGTGPYTYSWTGGITATTEDLTNLSAGSYTVSVTDANNCSATATITITQPAAALTLSSTQVDVLCFGANTGSINLTATGGTGPYTYSWTGGTTAATEDLTNLAAGTYTVTVIDRNNCIATTTVTINQLPALALTVSKIGVDCYGSSTGAIDINVVGGSAPYTYLWTGGKTNEDISGLKAGTYNVLVTDKNNCMVTASIIIEEPAAPLTLTFTKTDVPCFGFSNGIINLSVSGGTAPYKYSWTGGRTTEDLVGIAAGSYNVVVTDARNCTASTTITVSQPPIALSLNSTHKDVLCYGAENGSIDLNVTGGTAPYKFVWTGGSSTEDISGLKAGSYNVTVTDANNCSATLSVTINQPTTALELNLSKTDIICFGGNAGAINVKVSGGAAPYRYLWSDGNTAAVRTALAAGDYELTVTDANNCTKSASVTIVQPSQPFALNHTQSNIYCYGASTGSIDLNVIGGYAPYKYIWDNGKNTEDLSGLSAGSYTVTVTDSKGCEVTSSITITQPQSIEVEISKTNISCYGSTNGAISLVVRGGTAPYTYSWNNGKTTKDLIGLPTGVYSVLVTDAANCSVKKEIIISQPDPLKAVLSVKNASCLNNDGAISSSITGGIKPYKISWTGDKALSGDALVNLKSGSYEMIVTDAAGCTTSVKAELILGTCAPVAHNDKFSVEQDNLLIGDVAPNDISPLDAKLTFSKLTDPKNGTLTFEPNGKFTFLPDKGFAGIVEFSYQICNASGACHTAKVEINVSSFSVVNLTPELSSVWEGRKISVTARLERAVKDDVTITVEYSGKAEKERDYLVLDQYLSLTIPKGSLSTTQKMTIAALNDGFQEGDEDIIIKIKTVSNPEVRIGNGAVVIINDVYPPPPTTDVPQDEPINAEIVPDPLMSPNGDGSGNEFFTIQNIETYPDNEVVIFNRWGNELFAIKNYNNNDRNFKGFANKGLLVNSDLPLSDGVYFYIITTYRTIGPERTKQVNKGYLILKR